MNRLSIEPFYEYLLEWLGEHKVPDHPEGSYLRRSESDGFRKVDAYSPADMADICYTMGWLPKDETRRREWVEVLQSFQDPRTGLYSDPTHHSDHTTAYAISALDLFDALPLYPLSAYDTLHTKEALESYLDRLEWVENPWQAGNRGAGLATSLALTGEAKGEWFDWYFDWLDKEHDPETGFLRKGVRNKPVKSAHAEDVAPLLPAMAGSFHFHFVYLYFRRPFPYPEKMIDTVLKLQLDDGTFHSHGFFGFPELDAAFEMGRATRQCGYRFGDVIAALEKLAESAAKWANDPDWRDRHGMTLDDTHWMAGIVYTLAELQTLVPGLIDSPHTMRNILDRRPFV